MEDTGRYEVSAQRVVARVRAAGWRARFCRGAIVASVALAAALVVPAPAAWAQEIIDQPEQQPARELTAAEERARAAAEALEFRAAEEGEPVSYADVLRNPDDVELNFRFALQQVRRGDVKGAAATLERILLVNPDLAQVRLIYAVVLFRLDNLDQAEREFNAVAALEIAADVRTEVDSYLARIKRQRQTTRYTASLSLGMHYDTNRNAAPRSGTELIADLPTVVDDEEGDVGYLGTVSLRVDHDLGFQERHELFSKLTYYHNEQTAEDTFDLQAFTLNVGGVYHSPYWGIDVVPSVFRTHIRLSRATLFQDVGVNLRFAREFGPRIKAFVSMRFSDQTFSPISENTTSQERDGRQIEGSVGATYVIGPTMRIAVDYLHLNKRAKGGNIAGRGIFKFFSYDRDRVRLTHTWLLGGGQFMLNHFSYQRDRYEEPDPDISERTRHDDIFRYRFTYGAPLGFFFGRGTLWRAIEDITLSASAEWLEARSNLNNFEFRNVEVQGLLSKRWLF